jgi:hypothetical protein
MYLWSISQFTVQCTVYFFSLLSIFTLSYFLAPFLSSFFLFLSFLPSINLFLPTLFAFLSCVPSASSFLPSFFPHSWQEWSFSTNAGYITKFFEFRSYIFEEITMQYIPAFPHWTFYVYYRSLYICLSSTFCELEKFSDVKVLRWIQVPSSTVFTLTESEFVERN